MQSTAELLPLRKRSRVAKADSSAVGPNGQCRDPSPERDASRGHLWTFPLTPAEAREQEDARTSSAANFTDVLPDPVCLLIFSKLAPRHIAGTCSVVCKAWSELGRNEGLWKDLCTPWSLQESDTKEVLGGWKGLYGTALGTNLVQSPHFERLYAMDPPPSFTDFLRPFEASAKVLVERLCTAGEAECEYRSRSHWTDDVRTPFGTTIPLANAVYRTTVSISPGGSQQPQDREASGSCQESASASGSEQPSRLLEVMRTDHCAWGRLKQQICLSSFPERFLDSCPPIQVSAFCRPLLEEGESPGMLRMQLVMSNEDNDILHHWDSGELKQGSCEWRTVAAVVQGYPEGMRKLTVKVSGKGLLFTRTKATFDTFA